MKTEGEIIADIVARLRSTHGTVDIQAAELLEASEARAFAFEHRAQRAEAAVTASIRQQTERFEAEHIRLNEYNRQLLMALDALQVRAEGAERERLELQRSFDRISFLLIEAQARLAIAVKGLEEDGYHSDTLEKLGIEVDAEKQPPLPYRYARVLPRAEVGDAD
jgi:hypothetical protein